MNDNGRRIGLCLIVILALGFGGWLAAARARQETVSSRAYVGHEKDADIKDFIRQYPAAAGTRLDDCQTCHRGGVRGTDTEREYSPCGYCHLLVFPNPKYKTGVPRTATDTLNAYGLDYKKAGRVFDAFAAVAGLDSDGDGHRNSIEIADLRHPGDAASKPGLPLVPTLSLGWDEIRRLPVQSQFMLMNTSKERTDDYVLYRGVRIIDLLSAAKIYLTGVTGVTVFAPDGYSVDYTVEDIQAPFPRGIFYAGPRSSEDPEQAFVKYPADLPAGVKDRKKLPTAPWLLLAYERDGLPLDLSAYEPGTGRLAGEGPFRLVKPQRDLWGDKANPGRPDRSQKSKTFGDGWDYVPGIDHNAGACVRGACVIRVNPMPEGCEEYDWKNGWSLISEKKVVIYGRGVR